FAEHLTRLKHAHRPWREPVVLTQRRDHADVNSRNRRAAEIDRQTTALVGERIADNFPGTGGDVEHGAMIRRGKAPAPPGPVVARLGRWARRQHDPRARAGGIEKAKAFAPAALATNRRSNRRPLRAATRQRDRTR